MRVVRTLTGLLLVALLGVLAPSGYGADLEVRFVGMQGGKANLSIDRRSTLLKVGQTSKQGVMLLSVTRKQAVVRIGKRNFLFRKGAKKGVLLSPIVKLGLDEVGMYRATADINGVPVPVLVDTGATYLSLSRDTARKIGLKYRKNKPIKLQTASRVEKAYLTTVESVRLQGIVRLNVPTVITQGKHPRIVLLGMSFLQGLSVTQGAGVMTIRPQ